MNSFNCLGQYFYEACYFSVTIIHDLRKGERRGGGGMSWLLQRLATQGNLLGDLLMQLAQYVLLWLPVMISFYSSGGKTILKKDSLLKLPPNYCSYIFTVSLKTTVWLLLMVTWTNSFELQQLYQWSYITTELNSRDSLCLSWNSNFFENFKSI